MININSIVKEWSWRVNDGMPDPSKESHIELLEQVLIQHKYDQNFIDQFIKQIHPLNEASVKNSEITTAIKSAKKTSQFKGFLKNLPAGAPAREMISYLEKLDTKQAEEFASLLWSVKKPPSAKGGGMQNEIFELKAAGIGKGELWLAVMVKGSEIQGGGVSFDLQVPGKKYEVKDYSTDSGGVIRLGTEGALGSTLFWEDILETIKAVEKLDKAIPVKDYFDGDFASTIQTMIQRKSFTLKGEFGKKDMATYKKFYSLAQDKTKSAEEGFNRIDLRGPNTRPQSFMIKPIPSSVSGNSIKVELIKSSGKDSVISNTITELRRLKYVRQPSQLDTDLQKSVDRAMADGPADEFIVFRPGRIYVGSKFKFGSISQGGIKIIER